MDVKKDALPLVQETWSEFQKDEAGQLGAALSYYAMFSIFPLLLLLIAALGFALSYWDSAIDARAQILSAISSNLSPDLANTIGEVLGVVQEGAGAATGVGLVTLLLGASGVFQQLDLSFNKIWNVPQKEAQAGILSTVKTLVTDKLTSFAMVLAVGLLLICSIALTAVTQLILGSAGSIVGLGADSPVMTTVSFIIGLLITLLLNTLIFALLFKFLPSVKIPWSDVWLGAGVTAVLWEIAKRLLALYIGSSSYASAYGLVGTVLVLMAWIYFTSQVMFLGAEFTEVYSRRHGSRKPAPEPEPEPVAPTKPIALLPAPATPSTPLSSTTGKVAAAAGAGLLVGTLASLVAGVATVIIGTRRAVKGVSRRIKR